MPKGSVNQVGAGIGANITLPVGAFSGTGDRKRAPSKQTTACQRCAVATLCACWERSVINLLLLECHVNFVLFRYWVQLAYTVNNITFSLPVLAYRIYKMEF